MKTQHEFLRDVHELLEEAGIPYMIAGSVASTYHGRPRATQDVDVVIEPGEADLRLFVQLCIGKGYYADEDDARQALRHRSMFNVIDPASGYKLDLMVRKDRPFSREEFSRRTEVSLPGLNIAMVTAEDTILSKLEWARKSRSERQYLDALGVAITQSASLDVSYLRRWAKELGLRWDLEHLLQEAHSAATEDENTSRPT